MSDTHSPAIRRRTTGGAPASVVRADPPETHYSEGTPSQVRNIIEGQLAARKSGGGMRLRFHYGDSDTGRSWGDSEAGYVGRSTGQMKIPLTVHNRRSMGGAGIMTNSVVKVTGTRKGRGGSHEVLYQHPTYHENEEG